MHTFLIWTEVLFMQDISGVHVYTSLFVDTDWLKMSLRAQTFPRLLRNRPLISFCSSQCVIPCGPSCMYQDGTLHHIQHTSSQLNQKQMEKHTVIIILFFSFLKCSICTMCKESRVLYCGASGFCLILTWQASKVSREHFFSKFRQKSTIRDVIFGD